MIPDHANPGETDAIEMATRFCQSSTDRKHAGHSRRHSAHPVLGTRKNHLQAAPAEGTVLVPAADGRGTNAIFRRPASLFPARFGNDSFKPHHAAAQATGKPCVVLSLPGIALDVDNPEDLRALAAAPGETRAQRLIRQWDLADLPLAANE